MKNVFYGFLNVQVALYSIKFKNIYLFDSSLNVLNEIALIFLYFMNVILNH